ADRLLELAALALDLLDLGLELAGHLVELLPERGELVVAVGGDGRGEVALGEPASSAKELVDLTLQGAHDEHRQHEGEHEEAEQDHADQHPALSNRGGGSL